MGVGNQGVEKQFGGWRRVGPDDPGGVFQPSDSMKEEKLPRAIGMRDSSTTARHVRMKNLKWLQHKCLKRKWSKRQFNLNVLNHSIYRSFKYPLKNTFTTAKTYMP